MKCSGPVEKIHDVKAMLEKAAEMETAGVLWGFRDRKELEESKACHIVEKPEELFYLAAEKENNG